MNGTEAGCHVCKGPTLNGVCVESCPPATSVDDDFHTAAFISMDRNECVSFDKCVKELHMLPIHGECRHNCPTGYQNISEYTDQMYPVCKPCVGVCPKYCPGAVINYLSETIWLRGCTVINGDLILRLKLDVFDLHEQLERNLGDINEINGALLIDRYKVFKFT